MLRLHNSENFILSLCCVQIKTCAQVNGHAYAEASLGAFVRKMLGSCKELQQVKFSSQNRVKGDLVVPIMILSQMRCSPFFLWIPLSSTSSTRTIWRVLV